MSAYAVRTWYGKKWRWTKQTVFIIVECHWMRNFEHELFIVFERNWSVARPVFCAQAFVMLVSSWQINALASVSVRNKWTQLTQLFECTLLHASWLLPLRPDWKKQSCKQKCLKNPAMKWTFQAYKHISKGTNQIIIAIHQYSVLFHQNASVSPCLQVIRKTYLDCIARSHTCAILFVSKERHPKTTAQENRIPCLVTLLI